MRWLILGDEWPSADPVGGVATWTSWTAAALVDAGHAVDVHVRARPELVQVPGARVAGVRGPSFGRWGAWWHRLAADPARYDAVLAATWPVAARLLGPIRRAGIPLHVVYHGSDLTRPPRDPAAFAAVSGAATRWAVSGYLAGVAAARGFPASVAPIPLDPGPVRPRPPRLARACMVARATPLKGGDRFVRLVAALGIDGVIVGDGPALPAWRALAADVGARVRFTGWLPREGVAREVVASDLLISLPRAMADGTGAEGLGLAALEAAAAGVPSVGCATGGVPEAVDHLVDPDDPVSAASAIRAWWTPSRGADARARLAARHGRVKWCAALAGPAGAGRGSCDDRLQSRG